MENETVPQRIHSQSGELKPLRTYERDVEEVLHGQNVSLSKIALAESVKRRAPPAPAPILAPMRIKMPQVAGAAAGSGARLRPLFLFAIPLALFAGAVGLAWYFWGDAGSKDASAPFEPPVTQTEDAGIVLSGERRTAFIKRVRDEIAKAQVPLGEFRILPLKKKTGGQTEPLPFAELLGALEAGAPPSLVRALEEKPLFGIHGIRGNQPFFLFTVVSYGHAFDGMLAWEKEMLQDIGPLFGVNPSTLSNAPATTTADALARRLVFRDVVVKNKDLRAIFDGAGKIIFLYSFLDKQSLLITTNDETLKAVLPKVSRGRMR